MIAKQGFTMGEVMIVIVIVGFGLLPVLSMFLSGTGYIERGAEELTASMAAQNLLDVARSNDFIWEQIPNTVSIPEQSDKYPQFQLPNNFIKHYKARALIKVEEAPGHTVYPHRSIEHNLLQISVHITWQEHGKTCNANLSTYKALLDDKTVQSTTRM